jgi:hypothetical protein
MDQKTIYDGIFIVENRNVIVISKENLYNKNHNAALMGKLPV